MSALVVAWMLTASLMLLPAAPALAGGQVLELPPAAAPSASAPAPAPYAAPAPEPSPPPDDVADATPPPGVGGIDDYMHQDGQPHSSANQSGYAQGYGPSYSSPQPDPRNNPPSATTAAIAGAIAVGIIALDIYAAHHHR